MVEGEPEAPEAPAPPEGEAAAPPPPPAAAPDAPPPPPERAAALDRVARLLSLTADFPGAIDWAGARAQLEADLAALEAPLSGDDLARPYVAIMRGRLSAAHGVPPAELARAMAAAAQRLRAPIGAADLEALVRELG